MRYNATFQGRQLGAIGIFYRIETSVEADGEEQARLRLLERYDFAGPSFLRLTPADPCAQPYCNNAAAPYRLDVGFVCESCYYSAPERKRLGYVGK